MNSTGKLYRIKVLTSDGVKPIDEVNIGDKVYEYGTGNLLEVTGIMKHKPSTVYYVAYSDGRCTMFLENEPYFDGYQIIKDGFNNESKVNIIQHPIEFNKDKVVNPLPLDPYLAGPLFIYGDYTIPLMNLPYYPYHHTNKLNEEYLESLSFIQTIYDIDDKILILFKDINDKGECHITWNELCNKYNMNEFYKDKITQIPIEYAQSSFNDREKFIRGIFDIGCTPDVFDDGLGIIGSNENMMKEVQRVLLSLGILSRLTYSPVLNRIRGYEFRLDIIGHHSTYPGLSYNLGTITEMIELSRKFMNGGQGSATASCVDINMIKALPIKGCMYNLYLEKPNQIYLDYNYLPRVSL